MKLTLGQAARQAGISKSYLSRLIKSGKISGERQENGELRIDPSEQVLQREVVLLRELLHAKEQTLQDVRAERDAWRQQAQTLLLTEGERKSRRWWRFGKGRATE